ncbi:DUF6220 domain-containing protein [Salibacterium sp. K-3]
MGNQESNVTSEPSAPAIRYFRIGFAVLASIFAACIIVQVFFAGMALFMGSVSWGLHISFVPLFMYLPLLVLVFGIVGRLPKKLIWMNLMLVAMVILQYVTVVFSTNLGLLGAFHPIIAFLLLGASLSTAQQSWKYL